MGRCPLFGDCPLRLDVIRYVSPEFGSDKLYRKGKQMESKLPYISYPACVPRILNKVREAQTPDRFTYDFLETKLGFKGGNYKQFVSLAKRIGFLNTDGSPTDLYKQFRNKATGGPSVASAIKKGYAAIFERNEYANKLSKEDLTGLIVEITGLEAKNKVVQYIFQTFDYLKKFADFESKSFEAPEGAEVDNNGSKNTSAGKYGKASFALAYNINLVLPKTDDPAVFNAIFRSLKDNLMKEE